MESMAGDLAVGLRVAEPMPSSCLGVLGPADADGDAPVGCHPWPGFGWEFLGFRWDLNEMFFEWDINGM